MAPVAEGTSELRYCNISADKGSSCRHSKESVELPVENHQRGSIGAESLV